MKMGSRRNTRLQFRAPGRDKYLAVMFYLFLCRSTRAALPEGGQSALVEFIQDEANVQATSRLVENGQSLDNLKSNNKLRDPLGQVVDLTTGDLLPDLNLEPKIDASHPASDGSSSSLYHGQSDIHQFPQESITAEHPLQVVSLGSRSTSTLSETPSDERRKKRTWTEINQGADSHWDDDPVQYQAGSVLSTSRGRNTQVKKPRATTRTAMDLNVFFEGQNSPVLTINENNLVKGLIHPDTPKLPVGHKSNEVCGQIAKSIEVGKMAMQEDMTTSHLTSSANDILDNPESHVSQMEPLLNVLKTSVKSKSIAQLARELNKQIKHWFSGKLPDKLWDLNTYLKSCSQRIQETVDQYCTASPGIEIDHARRLALQEFFRCVSNFLLEGRIRIKETRGSEEIMLAIQIQNAVKEISNLLGQSALDNFFSTLVQTVQKQAKLYPGKKYGLSAYDIGELHIVCMGTIAFLYRVFLWSHLHSKVFPVLDIGSATKKTLGDQLEKLNRYWQGFQFFPSPTGSGFVNHSSLEFPQHKKLERAIRASSQSWISRAKQVTHELTLGWLRENREITFTPQKDNYGDVRVGLTLFIENSSIAHCTGNEQRLRSQ